MSPSRGLIGGPSVRRQAAYSHLAGAVLAPGATAARAGWTPSADGSGSPARDQRRQRRGPSNKDVFELGYGMNAVPTWAPAVTATMPLAASGEGG